jgi:ribokinase
MLSGVAAVDAGNAADAAAVLARRGPREVIVTLGADGVVWHSPQGVQRFAARKVQAVDTTAAGDTFIGALAALRVEGRPMAEALAHAIRAAAICVTRPGAQASMPTRAEADTFAP